MKSGIEIIKEERQRQISVEGWTSDHDDLYLGGELAKAASCYARQSELGWPWEKSWWKPSPQNRIRELAKAGALIAAEIDRLNRSQELTA